MSEERIPSRERLSEIVAAVENFVQTADAYFGVSGQEDPPGFPRTAKLEMARAIIRLEHALNPRQIAFGENGRQAFHPPTSKVGQALSWLWELHDGVLTQWKLAPICAASAWVILSEGGKHASQYADGTVPITVDKDWPPKIDRNVLEGMETAAMWIAEQLQGDGTPVAGEPSRVSRDEANAKARELLKADRAFANKTLREWARGIGCSEGLVAGLPTWKAVMERRRETQKAKKPKAVNLTDSLKAKTKQTTEPDPLGHLIAEQEADNEPSPLEDDPPGAPPKRVHTRKHL